MQRVYENEKWTADIKNWKPANGTTSLDCLEYHSKTNELFALLSGCCTLISAEETDGELKMEALEMELFKVYDIPQPLWHNTVTREDTKVTLIEDVSTGMGNSDTLDLAPAQVETLKSLAK